MELLKIENKAARLKLNETVHKGSMDKLVEEISRVFGAQAFENGQVTGEITNCIENAADTLDIEINSPGGSVLDGYTLYNALQDMRERGVYVTAHVTLAASMASVIAMAADKVVMRKGSRMMIHEASAGTQGDAAEHYNRAQLLDGISDEIAGIYAERTGMSKEKARKLMKKETWMDAKQAVEMGFADELGFDSKKKDKTMNILDRLTQPSDNEAKERIEALEAQVVENETAFTEFQAKLDAAEEALQAASTELIEVKAAKESAESIKAELEAKVADLEAKIESLTVEAEGKIEELENKAQVTEEVVAERASELLAQIGQPAPVAVDDDGTPAKSHFETFQSIKDPAAASAYYKEHRKEIQAEMRNASK